jgi:hypothetical protein
MEAPPPSDALLRKAGDGGPQKQNSYANQQFFPKPLLLRTPCFARPAIEAPPPSDALLRKAGDGGPTEYEIKA